MVNPPTILNSTSPVTNQNNVVIVYRLVSWDSIVKKHKNKCVSCEWGVGLYCEKFSLRSIFSGGALSTFIPRSLGKAGPFTLESHIHVKALNMQCFPNN